MKLKIEINNLSEEDMKILIQEFKVKLAMKGTNAIFTVEPFSDPFVREEYDDDNPSTYMSIEQAEQELEDGSPYEIKKTLDKLRKKKAYLLK